GATAAGDDRHVVRVAPLDGPGDLLGRAGQDDGGRGTADAAPLGLVGQVAAGVAGQHRVGAENLAELALDRRPGARRRDAHTDVTCSASTGACSFSTFMNSRIHSGWSGHARAGTTRPPRA